MTTKQVIFMDEEGCVEGGILVNDMPKEQYVICGCCGGILESDQYQILYEYPDWCNVSEEICGDYVLLSEIHEKVNEMSVEEVRAVFFGEKKLEIDE